MIKKINVIFILLFATGVFAARTVHITIPKGESLQLSNPSSTTVTYDLQCFDADGTSKANLTSQTLATQKSATFGKSDLCAGSTAPNNSSTIGSTGMLECTGSQTFANAETLCDSFYSLCTFNEVFVSGGSTSGQFWFNKITTSTDVSTDFGSTFNAMTATNELATSTTTMNQCRQGSDTIFGCVESVATASFGALCCPAGDITLCNVTINSTSGYLSSPNFKGGAPF